MVLRVAETLHGRRLHGLLEGQRLIGIRFDFILLLNRALLLAPLCSGYRLARCPRQQWPVLVRSSVGEAKRQATLLRHHALVAATAGGVHRRCHAAVVHQVGRVLKLFVRSQHGSTGNIGRHLASIHPPGSIDRTCIRLAIVDTNVHVGTDTGHDNHHHGYGDGQDECRPKVWWHVLLVIVQCRLYHRRVDRGNGRRSVCQIYRRVQVYCGC